MARDEGGADDLSRRALLGRAARLGLAAASLSLTDLLVACGSATPSSRSVFAVPTTAPSPSPPPTPSATADTRPVTVAITGDLMLGRSVNDRILATGDRFPFNGTADYLRSVDLTVGNLECVVSRLGQPVPNKPFHFRADPRSFERLQAAGFDIVSLANNHSGDYGSSAYADMLAQLPAAGLSPLGGGMTRAKAHQPVIRTVRSTTVGFLAYCEIGPMSFAAGPTSPGHAWLESAAMRSDIAALRPQVDYLVVFTHWGVEYQQSQSAHQRAVARAAIDSGADFVVGSHPHVVQPSEAYGGGQVVYSLGNFVFDQMYSADVRRGNVLILVLQGPRLVQWALRPSFITGDFGEPRWA